MVTKSANLGGRYSLWALLLLALSCTPEQAAQLDRDLYCQNMCDYAVRCNQSDQDTCVTRCTDRFFLEECAQDNFLATPFEVYSDCVKRLDCSEPEETCLKEPLEKDPLAAQCETWMDGCQGDVDHGVCRLTPFMTDEFRTEFRRCIRDDCNSPEIYDRCATLHTQCF